MVSCLRTDGVVRAVIFIKNAPSGWNTDNHYFYEIVNRSGTDVVIQLCFSSKNISHEQLELLNNINKISPMHQSKEDWQWWTAYKTDKVEIPEDLDEESIFKGLDAALVQAEHFESELKQKLAI